MVLPMVRQFTALCLLLLCLPVLQAQPINSFTIDNFNVGLGSAIDNTLDSNGAWLGMNPGSSVLGNYRVIGNYLTETISPTPVSSTNIVLNALSVNNTALTRSVGQVIWDGNDVTTETSAIIAHPASFNLGNLNFDTLLSSPNFNFQWSVINADDRNWNYTVRVYTDNATNYFEAVLASNQSGVTLSLPKSSFVAVGNPSWADVDAVSFSTTNNDGLLGGDLAIDTVIMAVPEPSAYLMIGLTAIVAGCYYTRKRRTAKHHVIA